MRLTKYIILLIISLPFALFSQEFNYWMNGIGARSTMLAGAITANDRDNSAIYYNPGGLANITNSSLSVSSNGYYYSALNIDNGAGTNFNLKSNSLSSQPQIVSFVQKVPKLPISLTFASLNRHSSYINTNYRNTMFYDVIPEIPGNELYVGSYSYTNKIKETWAGLGYGKKIRDNLGIGFSVFGTFRDQEMLLSKSGDVYVPGTDTTNLEIISNTFQLDDMIYRNAGLLFIVGVTWSYDKFRFGVNLTTPRINLKFLANSYLKRNYFLYNPYSADYSTPVKASYWENNVKSIFKSPLTLDLGIEYPIDSVTFAYGKISFFAPINKYKILIPNENTTLDIPIETPNIGSFTNMVLANKFLINIATSIRRRVSEKFEFLLGFKTDFNYLNKKSIDVNKEFYPGQTYWNLYHLTGGVVWSWEKFDLSLGGSYTFGIKNNIKQYVNLSTPTIDNNLYGVRDYSAEAKYNQASFFLGFTYFFSRI